MNQNHELIKNYIKKTLSVKLRDIASLPYQASSRRYWRVVAGKNSERFIVMKLFSDPLKSEEFVEPGNALSVNPFIDVARQFKKIHVSIPQIIDYNEQEQIMLLQDLGDTTLESYISECDLPEIESYYKEAVRIIVKMQQGYEFIDNSSVIKNRYFSPYVIKKEISEFTKYGLKYGNNSQIDTCKRLIKEQLIPYLTQKIGKMETSTIHRDFQSRNLMINNGVLTVIDFQDAMTGPLTYDLVSLLRDSYIILNRSMVDRLLNFYCELSNKNSSELFLNFDIVTIQRKLKDAGRFMHLAQNKQNKSFLKYFDDTMQYVFDAFERIGLFSELSIALKQS